MGWQDDPIIDPGDGGGVAVAPPAPAPVAPTRSWQDDPIIHPVAGAPVYNLAPLATQDAQQAANDQTFFQANANLRGFGPEVNNLATTTPNFDQADANQYASLPERQKRWDAKYREYAKTTGLYAPAPPDDMEPRPGSPPPKAEVAAGDAPEAPQQSLGQDLKNVPANVGAGVTRGAGGILGAVGTAIQRPGQIVRQMGAMFPTTDAAQTQTRTGIPDKPLDVQAGQFAQRQGDYLAQGAAQTEQDLPVQGTAGKLLVGAGELGVDAAMSTLVGPSGFVASFAGRSAGTMYVQARAQGDDENTAAGKALTAGFTAAVTPQLAHILPPQVGQEIATRAARAYLGTGGMVAAQATIDELTLKAGTTLKVDLSHVFPEAGVQGLIGVAMHGGHSALAAHQERAANPGPERLSPARRAEVPLTRPEDQPTPALQTGDYGAGLGKVPDLLDPVEPQGRLTDQPEKAATVGTTDEATNAIPIDVATKNIQETPTAPVPPNVQAEFDARGKAPVPQAGEPVTNVATDTSGVGKTQGALTGEAEIGRETPPNGEQQQPPAPERTAQPQTGQAPPAQRQPPGGAGLTIEPHGQGLRIIRASPKLTMLGEDWEGRKIATYNAKAGGWIFNPKNEAEVRGVMEKINGENKAAPSGLTDQSPEIQAYHGGDPHPLMRWLEANDPRWTELRNQQDSSHDLTHEQAREELHAHLDNVVDTIERGEAYAPETRNVSEDRQPEHQGTAGGGVSAETGGGDRTPQRQARQQAPKSKAGIERALLDHFNQHEGDSLDMQGVQDHVATEATGGASTVFKKIPSSLREAFTEKEWAQIVRRKLVSVAKPLDSISGGMEVSGGEDAYSENGGLGHDRYVDMIRRNLEGTKAGRLRAAVEFAKKGQDPEVRALAEKWEELHAITTEKAETPKPKPAPKFFDPAAEGIKSGEQKGIFGQSTFDAGTGKKQGGLFHEPVQVERPTGDSAAEAKIRAKFNEGEAATGEMFGNRTDAFGGPIKEKPATPAPERKSVTKSAVKEGMFGKDSFIGSDVVPLAKEGAKAIHEAAVQLQKTFAPQTRGEQAGTMQGIAREHGATLAQRGDRALEALKEARKAFDDNKPADNYDFIDKMEGGEKQANPRLTDAARRIRDMLDGRRREVQALGKGKLEHFIQDYFPHIWEDPEAAAKTFAQILGKRPLEGSKGFLKKRSIDTFSKGIELGLKPISDNPVDLVLLKIREMDRYILGQRMLAEMKGKGLAKFVAATERAPEGHTRIDDKIAQVYGPPTVKVEEHVDKAQYDALNQVMENLGIKHERVTTSLGRPQGGGKILGLATEGDKSIKTKFASGISVLAHEIGHQLDYKYNLTEKLLTTIGEAENAGIHSPTRPPGRFIVRPQSEFDALSKLRFTNVEKTTSKKYRDYNGSTREQMAQVLEAYMHAPDRMREVAPKVYQAFSEFLHSRPELSPLTDARSSLSHTELTNEVAHGGLLKMGEYYAPDAAAGVINNYLSPGLRDKSGLFRAYLGTANVMNQAQLGFSAFHVGFTSMDAMTSKLALGIEQAVGGKPVQSLASLAATPVAPFTNIIRGSKLLREWLKPGTEGADIARLVDGVRAAGGRAKQDNFYRTAMFEKMVGAFKKGNIIGGVLRLPAGALDLVAKPVMEYIVPRQKLGVFADLAQKQMAKLGPDASRDEVRNVLGKAWDSVDNRMGQVVYDNLFWNKAIKDISMASVRSLGWNLGTFRELGGGAIDFAKAGAKALQFQKPEFTHRMAYTLAMPALAGLIGGTLHYLMTGEKPDELRDYFFPKTGDTDANGHDVRLSLPSYMKDVYAYGHNAPATLGHKLHPAIATTIEMLQNKDFYGTKIANEDDPLMKRVMDRVKYVGKQFVPFGVQGYQKLDEEGAAASKKALPFIGITQAPGSVSMTKAEQVAQDLMRERMPVGSRTQVEADRTKAKTDIVKQIKAGKPGAMAEAREMLKRGEINVEDLRSMLKRSKQSPLAAHMEHLDIDDALKVWQVADAKERQELRPMMLRKVLGAQRMPNDQKAKARQAISKGEDVKLPG